MPVFSVDDLEIHFPFVPYDVQKELMTKVIECIDKRENGLLESPTGTGKTLSLLCAAVAWQKKQKQFVRKAIQAGPTGMINAFSQFNQTNKSNPPGSNNNPNPVNPVFNPEMFTSPKIIYASRTHSQLSQAVQELKRSYYSNTKTIVLGSRDVMCIHEEVSRIQSSSAKNMACQVRVKARSCAYYNNVAQKKEELSVTEKMILDIEDLVIAGKKNKFCPFFMSREVVKKDADVIFMPYNYLLDPKLRATHGIDLQNSIIILDEGHNIAKTCEESVSFELKSSTITKCIQEVTQTMNEFNSVSQQIGSGSSDMLKDLSMGGLVKLKQSFLDLEKELDSYPIKNQSGELLPGQTVLKSIIENGFPPSSFLRVATELDAISSFQMMNNHDSSGCDSFVSIIRVLGSQNVANNPFIFSESYKVFLTEEKKETKYYNKIEKPKSGNILKVFNFWCFNPALGLELVVRHGPRCIILASGTLSPLPFLESELRTPFPVKLSNPHIIGDNQLYACVLKNGPPPKSAKLSSNFQNRNNVDYLNGLGEVIRSVCSIVPKGVLVFFPSYTVMDNCVKFWETSRMIEQISSLKKVFIEPRGKFEFNQIIQSYYDAVKCTNGGCLMAVCRGKVSEGLDFANDNGRAVIITGIPYSPYLDPHVVAKKSYLDSKPTDKGVTKIDGRLWYQLEAVRALNQAVGRIIRHAQDYGAILLCDERCDSPDVLRNLSPWLEKRLKKISNFSEMMQGLAKFFNASSSISFGQSSSMFTKGNFPLSSSQVKSLGGSTMQRNQLAIEDKETQKEKDASLSQLYGENKNMKPAIKLGDDLFGNLGSLVTRPANEYSKRSSYSSIFSSDTKPCDVEPTSIFKSSISKPQQVKRKFKIEPVKMDYKSNDSLHSKKLKTSVFGNSNKSPEHGIFSSGSSSKVVATPSHEKSFPSIKEFFDWVKVELTSSQYTEFVNSIKLYKSDKDIKRFGLKIKSLFDRANIQQCLEGLKYVLANDHFSLLKKDIRS